MTIYESNYLKLRRLGALSMSDVSEVSCVPDDCDLHVEFVKREAYTTTLKLTYWFDDANDQYVADPDLTLRAYHDARLVEAVAVASHHRHHKLQELARSHSAELDRRWRRNITLNKWLDFLLDMGHAFA